MAVARVVPIIRVTDIPSAIDFYGSKLGFVTEFRYAAGTGGPWYAGLSLDGHHIHLSTFAGDGALGTAGYFYVDDVNAVFDRFRQAGLKVPGKPESPVEDGPVDQTWGCERCTFEIRTETPCDLAVPFHSRVHHMDHGSGTRAADDGMSR